MPDATFTSTCCDIFLFLLSLSPSHSLWRLTTDRNFKFNSPFSAGCQVTTPKVANPHKRPLNAILWFFFAVFVAGFLWLFITYTENVEFLKTFYFTISLRVVKHFQALAERHNNGQS